MGLFDYVNFKTKCPKCKAKVDGFQTKDSACLMNRLEFWETNRFYTSCSKCDTWIEFTIKKRPNRKLTIKDYKMKVKKLDNTKRWKW